MDYRLSQVSGSFSKYSQQANSGMDSMSIAIRAAQEKKIADSRDFFEQLVTDYPSCGRFWKAYIEQELKAKNFERVEKLFQRSLIKVLNIDLWKCYLNYVRDTKVKMANYKEKTAQAYDFALEKIGLDVLSYSIWVDYVNFLKSVEASGSFAENQKITAIRKVYQKGVMNPMLNIEQLWKDYCIFENLINPLIAKRMIDDRSKEFMTVRKIAKEYENVTRSLDRNSPSMPPQGTPEEIKQKQMWRKYIQWEKTNPLKSEDNSLIAKRVLFALEQSLLAMSSHVDIALEAVMYLQQQSTVMTEKCEIAMSKFYAEEALQMYEKLIKGPMSNNMLVYFAYADFEESRQNYQKVSQIYDKLLEIKDINPSLCYIQYMRFLRRTEGIRSARGIFKRAREDSRITYHVFISAALNEYYCTKDKTVANKIFQLGCKTFGHINEYILAYIEFLTHMNEDDMIRGFFESILSTGNNQIPNEKSGDIWSEWIEFESNSGDLKSINHVDEIRCQKYTKTELEDRQTLLLIDRYKFMNMYPVDSLQLKSLGYKNSLEVVTTSLDMIHREENDSFVEDTGKTDVKGQSVYPDTNSSNPFSKLASKNLSTYPQPDTGKMLPFKSNRNAFTGLLPVPGGGMFLFPSIIADMVRRLPPPESFNGPFVMIEDFLNEFKNLNIPDEYEAFVNLYENQNLGDKLTGSESKKKELIQEPKTEIQSSNNTLSPKSATSLNLPSSVSANQTSGLKRSYQQNKIEQNEDEENLGPGQNGKKIIKKL